MKNYTILDEADATQDTKQDYGIIVAEWSLEEIILPAPTKNTLDDVIAFCRNKEKIVQSWDLGRFLKGKGGTIAINFFGAPGTGKSITAEALAKAVDKNIIRADYSEISDSLFGGTEKKLTELFEKAERNNAVIFFDEADALLSKRNSDSQLSENKNQIKSHLLTLLDKSNVVIIFATNLFENYDKAFFRRILFHVEFKMPDLQQRIELWKFHLSEKVPREVSYKELAKETDLLAGGDIKNLTLKLCIKLSRKGITTINKQAVQQEVKKYRDALKASNQQIQIEQNTPPIEVIPHEGK